VAYCNSVLLNDTKPPVEFHVHSSGADVTAVVGATDGAGEAVGEEVGDNVGAFVGAANVYTINSSSNVSDHTVLSLSHKLSVQKEMVPPTILSVQHEFPSLRL
jgi:hypothetical protein